MLQFDLIENENKKPLSIYSGLFFKNKTPGYANLIHMLDTGASLPVWVAKPLLLSTLFKDAYIAPYKAILRGFGGNGSLVPVAILPRFSLQDSENNHIAFIDLPVLVKQYDTQYDMILSFSMFQHMKFSYTPGNNPKLVFDADKQIYGFGKRIIDGKPLGVDGTLLRDIYVLSQDTN